MHQILDKTTMTIPYFCLLQLVCYLLSDHNYYLPILVPVSALPIYHTSFLDMHL
jgi:hypothetical protein